MLALRGQLSSLRFRFGLFREAGLNWPDGSVPANSKDHRNLGAGSPLLTSNVGVNIIYICMCRCLWVGCCSHCSIRSQEDEDDCLNTWLYLSYRERYFWLENEHVVLNVHLFQSNDEDLKTSLYFTFNIFCKVKVRGLKPLFKPQAHPINLYSSRSSKITWMYRRVWD